MVFDLNVNRIVENVVTNQVVLSSSLPMMPKDLQGISTWMFKIG